MRIVLYDRTPVDYTPETPFMRALGGSESALCYLSIALARRSHAVTLVTNTSAPGLYRGVACSNHRDPHTPALLNEADIVIASNEALGRWLRDNCRVIRPLVLWVGHAHDQPAVKGLESSRERKIWSGFAFVSRWQLEQYVDHFWVPEEKSRVMRNAVSAAFADLTLPEAWFASGRAPVLVYTSQPYRGLDVLLDAFPLIRAKVPDVRLKVFSGFAATYKTDARDDPFRQLYQKCMSMDGVEYVGPVAQTELARELAEAAVLAYPSTYLETSCISAMEAMAAGLTVCTTNTAAMPETTAGYGCLIDYENDHAKLAQAFAATVVQVLDEARRAPGTAAIRRDAQIAFVREHYTWDARAIEWENWLLEIVQQQTH